MSSCAYLLKKEKRRRKVKKTRNNSLKGCPQKKGIIFKLGQEKPKKPNSAKRHIVKLRLSTGKRVRAHVPGEGNPLKQYKRVLIRGGRTRDLPGIRYKVIRGSADCPPIYTKRKSRSRCGLSRLKLVMWKYRQKNQ